MATILTHVLATPAEPEAVDGLDGWWALHRARARRFERPFDLAVAGGFAADRLAYAFASGYQAALAQMFGANLPPRIAALCATEAGGAHPRAIETTLRGSRQGRREELRLTGRKTYVSMGTHARRLYVVATTGKDEQGRNRLKLVALDARREGVHLEARPAGRFVPEVPHAELTLDGVLVHPHEVLAGDGYARYLKPFRTVEDVHVLAAAVAWWLQVGRRSGWSEAALAPLVTTLAALAALAEQTPSDPGVHVALGGVLADLDRWRHEHATAWAGVDEPTRERWERDAPLLQVARGVRERRLSAAWARLRGVAVLGVALGACGGPAEPTTAPAARTCEQRLVQFTPSVQVVQRRLSAGPAHDTTSQTQFVASFDCQAGEADEACRARAEKAMRERHGAGVRVESAVFADPTGPRHVSVRISREQSVHTNRQQVLELLLEPTTDPREALARTSHEASGKGLVLSRWEPVVGGILRVEIECRRDDER